MFKNHQEWYVPCKDFQLMNWSSVGTGSTSSGPCRKGHWRYILKLQLHSHLHRNPIWENMQKWFATLGKQTFTVSLTPVFTRKEGFLETGTLLGGLSEGRQGLNKIILDWNEGENNGIFDGVEILRKLAQDQKHFPDRISRCRTYLESMTSSDYC